MARVFRFTINRHGSKSESKLIFDSGQHAPEPRLLAKELAGLPDEVEPVEAEP